jgi:integrase
MAVKKRGSSYQVGYSDSSGKWRTKTFHRKKDADAFFETTKREVRLGIHVTDQDTVTVRVACEKWLTTCELDGLASATRKQYAGHVHNHVIPAKLGGRKSVILGDVLLTRLSRPLITDFRDHLLKTNSHATARKIWVSFKAMLSDAETRGLIGHNPAAPIFIKEDERGHMQDMALRQFPQPAEIRGIIETATGRMKSLLTVAAFVGLRSLELRGLYWEDCDFVKHRINVRRRADETNKIGPLKSKAAHRSIPMTPEVEKVLREWRGTCPRQDGKLVLVFPNGLGKVQAHNHLIEWGYHPVQVQAGIVTPRLGSDGKPELGKDGQSIMIAKYGLHDLRHFFASWLINELRCNPNKVKTLVGHASIKLTYDIYGHLFDDDDGDNLAFAAGSERVMSARLAVQAT